MMSQDIRKYLSILNEKSLQKSELAKDGGKYLQLLIQFVGNNLPIPVDPKYRDEFGDYVQIDPDMVPIMTAALNSNDIKNNLPQMVSIIVNDEKKEVAWGVLFKGKEFTGKGEKAYNAGHLAEVMMGLSVAAKFYNLGQDITVRQLMSMIHHIQIGIQGNNYRFSHNGKIRYPESGTKEDTLNFLAVVPAKSAEVFVEQMKSGQLSSDIEAILASAVLYCNESEGVQQACNRVRLDKENNVVDVISDGTSDAKGTKADLTLKVDGEKINLLSLKTYSTSTIGQISGISYDQLSKWFRIAFGIDISGYQNLLDPTLDREEIFTNVLTEIYDKIVYPQVRQMIEDQSPAKEAAIVRQLAQAALYHARGEKLENVEIVKLDDKVKTGNYKILRFSDNLYEAMKHLDLEVKYLDKGRSRTIQIWIKPEPNEKVDKGANKLCQFRTTKMGESYRNYYEIGPIMEKLTGVNVDPMQLQPPTGPEKIKDPGTSLAADRIKRPAKALQFPTASKGMGREKR